MEDGAAATTLTVSLESSSDVPKMLDDPLKVWVPVQVLLADKDTPAAGVVDAQVVPFDVSTLPDVPGATTCTAEVPLPSNTLLTVKLVAPVPPLATATVPVTLAAVPVVFWLNVGQVNVPVLKLPDVGVPSNGVTNVGEVANTTEPEPVDVVLPVPPLATGNAVPL